MQSQAITFYAFRMWHSEFNTVFIFAGSYKPFTGINWLYP